jgi:hypothetical protein
MPKTDDGLKIDAKAMRLLKDSELQAYPGKSSV